MGIRFYCPNGHKLNVKDFLAGRRGICPFCGAKMLIPLSSTRPASKGGTDEQGQADMRPSSPSMSGEPDPAGPSSMEPMPNQSSPQDFSAETSQLPQNQPAFSQLAVNAPANIGPNERTDQQAPFTANTVMSPPTMTPSAEPTMTPGSEATYIAQGQSVMPPPVDPPVPHQARPLDPFDEAPDAVWYVRPESGGQFGPASADVMRTWMAEGRIVAGSLVWREGWRDWQDAAVTFPQLAVDEELAALSEISADAGSTAHAAGGHHPPARRKSNSPNVGIIVLLSLAVIALVVVFYFVVM